MARLHVETHGSGRPVLFIHGAMGHGREAWAAQLSLAERWRLLIADRPGYGQSDDDAMDAEAQAAAMSELLDGGADVVGHSYGGVLALLLAGRYPDRVRSVTVIEPPATALVDGDVDVDGLEARTRPLFSEGPAWPAERILSGFSQAFGFDATDAELDEVARRDMAASVRDAAPWTVALPLDRIAAAGIRTLVVTGGWPAGEMLPTVASTQRAFAAIARALVDRVGAEHAHFPEAYHDVQSLGEPFNERLIAFIEGG